MAPRRKETPVELCDKAVVLGNTIAIRMLEYLSTVKNHVQGFGDLAAEFLDVCRILWAIESGLNDTKGKHTAGFSPEMTAEMERHFRQAHDDFIVLNQLVTRFLDNDKKHGFARVAKGFKMMFADSDVQRMRNSLEKSSEALRMSALVFRWSLGGDEVDATIGIGYTGLAAALDRLNGVNKRTASRNTLQPPAPPSVRAPVTPQRGPSNISRAHTTGRLEQGPELPPALPPLSMLERHSTQSHDFMGNRMTSTSTLEDLVDMGGLSERGPSRSARPGSGSLRSSKNPAHTLAREFTHSNTSSSPTRSGSSTALHPDNASTHTAETELLLDDLLSDVDLTEKPPQRVKADPSTVPRWTPRYNTGSNNPQLKVALAQAVQKRNHAIIEQLLDRGVPPESPLEMNLLREAIMNRDTESVRLLLLFGADPNTFDKNDYTPLFQAAEMGILEGAKLLVKYGADPNLSAGMDNDTPLALAVLGGQLELVQLFLTYGGDPNRIMANDNTVLVRAMHRKTPKPVVEVLLNYGGDANAKNGEGTTPLIQAISAQRLDLAQLLLDRGADPNLPGPKHPLWPGCYHASFLELLLSRGADFNMAPGIMEFATSINNADSVRTLLGAGVDPNAKKDGVYTPLCSAIRDDRADIVSLLLASGADPNLSASEYPCFQCVTHHRSHFLQQIIEAGGDPTEPRGIVEKAVARDNMDALVYLLDHGVDANAKSTEGYTPLTTAIREDRADMVDLLLGRGAEPGVRGQDWPLCMAVKRPAILKKLLPAVSNPKPFKGVVEMAVCANELESIRLLLGAGFSVEDKNGGVFSPLTSAIREGHKDMVRFLLDEAGANVNAAGEHLPIIKAIRRMCDDDTEILEMLLARGADINLMYRGWNAVLQAIENGDAHVLKLLVEKGNGVDLEVKDENDRTIMEVVNEQGFDEAVSILGGGRRLSVFSSLSWGDILGEDKAQNHGRSMSRTSMATIQEPASEDEPGRAS